MNLSTTLNSDFLNESIDQIAGYNERNIITTVIIGLLFISLLLCIITLGVNNWSLGTLFQGGSTVGLLSFTNIITLIIILLLYILMSGNHVEEIPIAIKSQPIKNK
jgi:hypothetical protein